MPSPRKTRGHTGVFLMFLVMCSSSGYGKICGSLRLQNNVEDLEQLRDCTIIAGHLWVVLIENVTEDSWKNFTFPNLVEIWDYMVVCQVKHLTSLGKLFPNLRIIKGLKTFQNYALIIYSVKYIKKIGLTSLRRIERGDVMIGSIDNLCYYNTIDWKTLGTELRTHNLPETDCEPCASECNGECWSKYECQNKEIIKTCPRLKDEGLCVDRCPKDKVILNPGNECITTTECETIDLKRPWFSYNGSCINKCPDGYAIKNKSCEKCNGYCVHVCEPKTIVSTLSSVTIFDGCTHINGSLQFKITEQKVADELEKYMSDVREIWGFLKITRSPAITSMGFLPKLELIRGDVLDNNNSLVVFENQNLKTLWPIDTNFKLHIKRGNMLFHYNPQLCYQDIEKLNNFTLSMEFTPVQVSKESNGDQRLCQELDITVEVIPNPTNVTLRWHSTSYQKRGYFVYYIEGEDDLSEQDVCKNTTWAVVFTTDNNVTLLKLKAYTYYSYYIVVTIMSANSQAKTKINSFMTTSDDPSVPRNVEAFSYNSTAIMLTWDPPEEIRGVLKNYVISYYKIPKDDWLLSSRDYCRHPVTNTNEGIPLKEVLAGKPKPIKSGILINETCVCPIKKQRDLTLSSFLVPSEVVSVKRFDEKISGILNINDRNRYHISAIDLVNSTQSYFKELIISADQNQTLIGDLDHFTTYVFYVSACNENRTVQSQCSEISMVYNRTRRLAIADTISEFSIAPTNNGAVLNWSNPINPNSAIVSYTVDWKGESSREPPCILPSHILKDGYRVNLPPGYHKIRIRANTLAGPGEFTEFQSVNVGNTYNNVDYALIVGLSFAFVIIVACGLYIYYRYRRRKHLEHIHLIQSVNPDYCGSAYLEDEWEIERDDIEIGIGIGKGTFGTVYSGFIKSRQLSCAVKTVNINATQGEKLKFLNEASVMKTFSNAHHVVRLIGVTSKGPSPLVIMELMACGDLKTFLRRSRDSSQTIGCNEMYRMAIEIADGMAYLAAKKFIHCDLAARNCMVAGDHTIKIGDFGMAHDIYETDYYRKDSRGLLPVRWMAPESLADGLFTTDSDVWSYGVVLWEMATLSEQPYQGLGNDQVRQFVVAKGRLNRPPECPDLLYEIMDVCWRWHPNKRPQFVDIVAKLETHVSEDFKVMSFYHSREGNEYQLNVKERPYNSAALPGSSTAIKNVFAHYHKNDENIDLYNEDRDPITSNHRQNQFADFVSDEDDDDLPGSNGYASLSKTPL